MSGRSDTRHVPTASAAPAVSATPPAAFPVWVFAYGTLQPGQCNFAVAAPFVLARQPGRVRGRLVDAANGHYPALVRELSLVDRAVRGWWLKLERDGLAACDRLEDFFGPEEANDYERIWTRDLDDPDRQGWIYVWPSDRGCSDLLSDIWPPGSVPESKSGEPE